MRYKETALDRLKDFIAERDDVQRILCLKHKVARNWSQMHKTTYERTRAIHEVFTQYDKHVYEYWMDRAKFLELGNADLKRMCEDSEVLSVASLVETRGQQTAHLPLMNFHPRTGVTVEHIADYLKYISHNRQGVILKTDRYYHYIGFYLLTNDEWIRFLGKMLVPFVFVNPGYIGYSLLRGYCCIRLTNANEIKRITPYVIMEL